MTRLSLRELVRTTNLSPTQWVKWLRSHVAVSSQRESVFFITFHKCASSLFTGFVLKHVDGLYHVNYEGQYYHGKRDQEQKADFRRRGHVYGPIRLSSRHAARKHLVERITDSDFIRDKIAVLMVRDPRDILISLYYSAGFTHTISPVKVIADSQVEHRQLIQGMSLDEYVLADAATQVDLFLKMHAVSEVCERSVLLRFEDMVSDFDRFAAGLTKYLPMRPSSLRQIYLRSRPRSSEDITSHRRSGQVANFRSKLRPETVEKLSEQLSPVLDLFGYTV